MLGSTERMSHEQQQSSFPEIDNPEQAFMGAKGLVFIGDQVLVYRRDQHAPTFAGWIDVPGGGREGKETPFETFVREVAEEFGLVIMRDDIVYARHYASENGPAFSGWFLVAQLAPEAASDIVFGDEGDEFYLMPLDVLLARDDVWPKFQQRVADYAPLHPTDAPTK